MLNKIIELHADGFLGYLHNGVYLSLRLAPVVHPLYNMYQATWRSVVVVANTSSLITYKTNLEAIDLRPIDFTPREIGVIQSRIAFLGDVIVSRIAGTSGHSLSGQEDVPARIGHEHLDCLELSDFFQAKF